MSAEDVRAELAEVLAGHHCRMHRKGPIECWSTLDDQECGLRFTTGGQYRAHVAEVLAEYVASKQAEFVKGGQAWDAMQAHIDKRKAEWQAEALRDAAEEVHREARWIAEQVMRGQRPDPLDRVTVLEQVLRDRADRIAP